MGAAFGVLIIAVPPARFKVHTDPSSEHPPDALSLKTGTSSAIVNLVAEDGHILITAPQFEKNQGRTYTSKQQHAMSTQILYRIIAMVGSQYSLFETLDSIPMGDSRHAGALNSTKFRLAPPLPGSRLNPTRRSPKASQTSKKTLDSASAKHHALGGMYRSTAFCQRRRTTTATL